MKSLGLVLLCFVVFAAAPSTAEPPCAACQKYKDPIEAPEREMRGLLPKRNQQRADLNALDDERRRIQTAIEEGKQELARNKADQPDLLAERKKLEGELKATDQEIARGRAELDQAKSKISSIMANITALKEKLTTCVRTVCDQNP